LVFVIEATAESAAATTAGCAPPNPAVSEGTEREAVQQELVFSALLLARRARLGSGERFSLSPPPRPLPPPTADADAKSASPCRRRPPPRTATRPSAQETETETSPRADPGKKGEKEASARETSGVKEEDEEEEEEEERRCSARSAASAASAAAAAEDSF
jgi:hypothetical protein